MPSLRNQKSIRNLELIKFNLKGKYLALILIIFNHISAKNMPKYAENTSIWLQPVLSSRDFYKIVIEVNPKRFQTVAKGDQIQSYYDRKEKIIVLRKPSEQQLLHEIFHVVVDSKFAELPYPISEFLVEAMQASLNVQFPVTELKQQPAIWDGNPYQVAIFFRNPRCESLENTELQRLIRSLLKGKPVHLDDCVRQNAGLEILSQSRKVIRQWLLD